MHRMGNTQKEADTYNDLSSYGQLVAQYKTLGMRPVPEMHICLYECFIAFPRRLCTMEDHGHNAIS